MIERRAEEGKGGFCNEMAISIMESVQKIKFEITINRERCKRCGYCVYFCPKGVFRYTKEFNSHGYFSAEVVNPGNCTGCRFCQDICPDFAIRIWQCSRGN